MIGSAADRRDRQVQSKDQSTCTFTSSSPDSIIYIYIIIIIIRQASMHHTRVFIMLLLQYAYVREEYKKCVVCNVYTQLYIIHIIIRIGTDEKFKKTKQNQ